MNLFTFYFVFAFFVCVQPLAVCLLCYHAWRTVTKRNGSLELSSSSRKRTQLIYFVDFAFPASFLSALNHPLHVSFSVMHEKYGPEGNESLKLPSCGECVLLSVPMLLEIHVW